MVTTFECQITKKREEDFGEGSAFFTKDRYLIKGDKLTAYEGYGSDAEYYENGMKVVGVSIKKLVQEENFRSQAT